MTVLFYWLCGKCVERCWRVNIKLAGKSNKQPAATLDLAKLSSTGCQPGWKPKGVGGKEEEEGRKENPVLSIPSMRADAKV